MQITHKTIQSAAQNYRSRTYRFIPALRIKSESQAIDFVNERQFIFFWPIKKIPLPSLWGATVGDRPVPNNHDDPGHVTWRWKDNILGQKKWYYAKILRRKSTIISLDLINSFFAISDSAFHTIEDLEYLYRMGKRSRLEIEIFTLLLSKGPLDSITLREKLRMRASFSSSEYNRALSNLQKNFYIMPMGISENGRWHYSYMFDIVEHMYPKKIEAAYKMTKIEAREKILLAYLRSNGIVSAQEIKKLFQWKSKDIHEGLERLLDSCEIEQLIIGNSQDEFFACKDFRKMIYD